MAKLTKAQSKQHLAACAILAKDGPLSDDDKEFVARNWNEAAESLNTVAGAHFTPLDMAFDVAFDITGPRVLDLCAGIGILGLAAVWRHRVREEDLICIELNPAYIAVGKRLLPKATWIEADAFTFPALGLGQFDTIVSNPPFGQSAKKTGSGPRYTGPDFDLALLDLAADHAAWLAFILPQGNSPFRYSGAQCYDRPKGSKGERFQEQTGLHLDCGIGVDTSVFKGDWKTVNVTCEVVCVETGRPYSNEVDLTAPAVVAALEANPGRDLMTPEGMAALHAMFDAAATPLPVTEPVTLADGPALQSLVPGVAPLSAPQLDLATYAAKRAQKRQSLPMPTGGLFDDTARNQLSLFA